MGLSFTSLEFCIFLGTCLALARSLRKVSAQTWLLVIFSYIFYLSFGALGVLVVTLSAVAVFHIGRQLGSLSDPDIRNRWLWAGIAVNVGPLAFFKYSAFILDNVASVLQPVGVRFTFTHHPVFAIVGLSYFSFSGMSYILDVYYEKIDPTQSISEYVCYLVFFPKLVAGPIVRAGELLPQLRKGLQFNAQDFEAGCAYLLVGAIKKLVIADQLTGHVSMILASPQQYSSFTLVQGLLGYTVQIYADFSGYSDMAIGCARLMGIRLPQNFLMPYSSVNVAEFWRRWHVTMSSWFRDYVFLPLEIGGRGTRNANVRIARNMIITMLLCGLWHGAGWNFVLWGGLHGVALAVYQWYAGRRQRRLQQAAGSTFRFGTLAARLLTLSVVMIGWILFGTSTLASAFTYLWRILTWAKDGIALGSPYILPLTAVVFIAHLLINKDRNLIEELGSYSVPTRTLTYACLLLILTTLVPSEAVPFVYVHF